MDGRTDSKSVKGRGKESMGGMTDEGMDLLVDKSYVDFFSDDLFSKDGK